jgi:hypothetical protein
MAQMLAVTPTTYLDLNEFTITQENLGHGGQAWFTNLFPSLGRCCPHPGDFRVSVVALVFVIVRVSSAVHTKLEQEDNDPAATAAQITLALPPKPRRDYTRALKFVKQTGFGAFNEVRSWPQYGSILPGSMFPQSMNFFFVRFTF